MSTICFVLFCFVLFCFFNLRERKSACASMVRTEREGERILSRLHTYHGAQFGAGCHDCEIMTWVDIKSQTEPPRRPSQLLFLSLQRNCEATEERWKGGGRVWKSHVAWGVPEPLGKWRLSEHLGVDICACPRGRLKTSLSVSIWNLICQLVLKFSVKNIPYSWY